MLDRRATLYLGAGAIACGLPSIARAQTDEGFSGNPLVELMTGRSVKVREALHYKDPSGTVWSVPENFVCDGASIPQVLWSAEGGPLDGPYRDAAIIHDRYCDTMQRSWESTHQVFYHAMRARGVGAVEATRKYWAVYYFGPRWDATHRWTSFLELKREQRRDLARRKSIMGALGSLLGGSFPERPQGPPTRLQAAAQSASDEQILKYQQLEFERASQLIVEQELAFDDIPALLPAGATDPLAVP